MINHTGEARIGTGLKECNSYPLLAEGKTGEPAVEDRGGGKR